MPRPLVQQNRPAVCCFSCPDSFFRLHIYIYCPIVFYRQAAPASQNNSLQPFSQPMHSRIRSDMYRHSKIIFPAIPVQILCISPVHHSLDQVISLQLRKADRMGISQNQNLSGNSCFSKFNPLPHRSHTESIRASGFQNTADPDRAMAVCIMHSP